jgi:hypothetical protein
VTKFYKKVLTVDVIEWPGEMTPELRTFLQHDAYENHVGWNIVCVGGLTRPQKGDWIVRDENGVVSVLAPNIFKERYAEVAP